ncbi:hypothetical protein CARUB_v10027714mg [Capsella rubella]|uniref:C2H2-type domain-containing protein n=1 Tax=Capsella rubella TaxID=81985 RepID=R0ETM1_9BRAS|nr:uncharacterized protein LOC17875883 [Capsella rubella]EOA12412.1 hypothetical protein CARUB_v10027714mg [Capsella rubella]
MENQSPVSSSNSSSPPKDDRKRKTVAVAEEKKKETMNLQRQKPPRVIVSERTVLERPSFVLEVVPPERDNMVYLCDLCDKGFSSQKALAGHQNTHREAREIMEMHKKQFNQPFHLDTCRMPFDSYGGMSFGPFRYGGGSSSRPYLFSTDGNVLKKMKTTTMLPPPTQNHPLTESTGHNSSPRIALNHATNNVPAGDDEINLELTLAPPNSKGASSGRANNNTNPSLNGEAARGTPNLITPVSSHVSRFNYAAGNPMSPFTGGYVPLFGNTNPCHGMGSSGPNNSLFSMGMNNNAMVPPPYATYYPPTNNLCHDLFSLQGNGAGSSTHPNNSPFSMGMNNNAMVPPPFPTFYPPTNNVCRDLFSLQGNGAGGSSHSRMEKNKAVIVPSSAPPPTPTINLCMQGNGSGSGHSEEENKVMEPEDDDRKDIEIRWLTKKKRSGRD